MRAGWKHIVLGVVLLTSLGANACMLWRRHATLSPAATPVAAPRARPSQPEGPGRPSRHSPVPVELAAIDRGALEVRLAAAEKEVVARLRLDEKYELAERDSLNEDRLRLMLDEALADDDGEPVAYDLECHGQICSITNVALRGWQDELQRSPATYGMFHSFQIGPGRGQAMVELEEPRRTAAIQLFIQLATALKISPAVAECRKTHPGTGVVEIAFYLDAGTRRLGAIASGATAARPGADCVLAAAASLAAGAKVATDVTEMPDWVFPIEVP